MPMNIVPGAAPPLPGSKLMAPATRARAIYRHMGLWSLQGWLAMFFIAAGYTKLTEPDAILIQLMGWPAFVDPGVVRGLGGLELALALASLSPLVSWQIGRPVLLASAGMLLLMEGVALVVHGARGEAGLALTNLLLIAITMPILIGRAGPRRSAPDRAGQGVPGFSRR